MSSVILMEVSGWTTTGDWPKRTKRTSDGSEVFVKRYNDHKESLKIESNDNIKLFYRDKNGNHVESADPVNNYSKLEISDLDPASNSAFDKDGVLELMVGYDMPTGGIGSLDFQPNIVIVPNPFDCIRSDYDAKSYYNRMLHMQNYYNGGSAFTSFSNTPKDDMDYATGMIYEMLDCIYQHGHVWVPHWMELEWPGNGGGIIIEDYGCGKAIKMAAMYTLEKVNGAFKVNWYYGGYQNMAYFVSALAMGVYSYYGYREDQLDIPREEYTDEVGDTYQAPSWFKTGQGATYSAAESGTLSGVIAGLTYSSMSTLAIDPDVILAPIDKPQYSHFTEFGFTTILGEALMLHFILSEDSDVHKWTIDASGNLIPYKDNGTGYVPLTSNDTPYTIKMIAKLTSGSAQGINDPGPMGIPEEFFGSYEDILWYLENVSKMLHDLAVALARKLSG